MLKLTCCAVAALILTPTIGAAQDFEAGFRAAEAGDYAAALREWRPLAERGNVYAQVNLGLMYSDGNGVPQNHAEALRWYRTAAEQGFASAQSLLGVLYFDGFGSIVTQDVVAAHMWSNIAAANGDDIGRSFRAYLDEKMTAEAISEAHRRAQVCMESDYQDCD